ncbi:CDP-diacylglycerol--glycerol-3-phosphate 3-phosphatidyltransferase [Alicyclobacillus cellulosilyticus]|uniref:CDP-diacylglycerol--glycerol-3-phosphate 3-phosphatidyltransferase n=1 Tax=Alicyclobacillus cellulosilyticus TaxID=1003997 RepID=A0A917NPS7_9BACL|nr:CDP-diacylglycerol--glycerol-3-phosphate 3-phosphatidyltransferase [Alicyclobacillus cellulosilyticus]GGJ13690.1 CDP-diacylglycerol--glycerol-3-phosphate 3-phosphatidyltransferase [Alicyclobacillus cellulosilyticus]
MNLPNTLTLFRLLLIPFYLWSFYSTPSPHKVGALFVLLVAGLTDILDGYIARKRNAQTQAGQLLDPLADKLMMVAVLFSLIQSNRVPWGAAGLLVLRDAAMILGGVFFYFQGKRAVPKANWWGKTSTILYYITICAVMLAWPAPWVAEWLLWITVCQSYLATFLYVASMQIISVRRVL